MKRVLRKNETEMLEMELVLVLLLPVQRYYRCQWYELIFMETAPDVQ